MKKIFTTIATLLLCSVISSAQSNLVFQDLSSMNYARGLISSANDGNNLYVCNGFSTTADNTTEIEKYNIATNTWSVFAYSLVGKRYPSSEVVGNNLYIINGIYGTTYNNKVEIVNLTDGSVTYSTDNPYPARSSGSSVWNSKIYIFGGSTATGYSNKLYCFDTETKGWTELANMPEAKETKGEIVNGKLYVIGGFNGTTSTRIDVYDIQTDTWSFVMNMAAGVSAHATAAYQNKIWIIGDYTNLTYVAHFDVTTNELTSCTNSMTGRRHAGAEVVNGKLYAMGGNQTSFSSSCLSSLQIADIYQAPEHTLSFDNLDVLSGRTFAIPINISELTASDNVLAYQFDFNYDNTYLEYVGYSLAGTLAENGSLQVNPSTGKLSIAWARGTALIGTGTIIKLQFKSVANGATTPTCTNALYNTTVVTTTSGTITAAYNYGDVDANDCVQAYDAALAIQYSVGLDPIPTVDPLPWEAWRVMTANVDGIAGVTANDASEILKYTVGLISAFPAEGGKKSEKSENADVNITLVGNELVFQSMGELFSLNLFVNENKNLLGIPQFLNTNMLTATNISTTSYAIGLATSTAPTAGETFMKIPFTTGQNANITFDMIVNTTVKQVTMGLTTGIIEIIDKDMLIYPNPAKNTLFVNGLIEKSKISISDLSGKMIFNRLIDNNQIDISNFPTGIYIVRIETAKGTTTKKFVKQ